MIRVTIDVVPGGDEKRKRELGLIEIANLAEPGPTGDYQVRAVVGLPNGDVAIKNRMLRGYERRRWNALRLVYAALEALEPDTMRNDDQEHPSER